LIFVSNLRASLALLGALGGDFFLGRSDHFIEHIGYRVAFVSPA
jgi:hypothetical protein